ncbi:MAG: hypothetical protein ABJO01_10105 [Parasphingorhabdus sp.]|uniref:hypothetical protein n=1 Tax=Parasphingorhabdus sp. TaxID=2709688 RepID=UPI0032975011
MSWLERKSPARGGASDQLGCNDLKIIEADNGLKLPRIKKTPTAVIVCNITQDGEFTVIPGYIGKFRIGEIGMPLYPYIKLHSARQAAECGGVVHFACMSDGVKADFTLGTDKFLTWDNSFKRLNSLYGGNA